MAETISYARLLSVCLFSAKRAGAIIRDVRLASGNASFQDKNTSGNAADWDPQTVADVKSQQLILDTLHQTFPNLRICGEEDVESMQRIFATTPKAPVEPPNCDLFNSVFTNPSVMPLVRNLSELPISELTVWVDPLDGTREFVQGPYDVVTTLVGISLSGTPLAGVVYAPFSGDTYVGGLGLGVFSNKPLLGISAPFQKAHLEHIAALEALIGVPSTKTTDMTQSTVPPLSITFDGEILHRAHDNSSKCTTNANTPVLPVQGRVVVTSSTRRSEALLRAIQMVNPSEIRSAGGAGNKAIQLLRGLASAYIYPQTGTKRWDTCAVHALIRTMGGELTDMHGGAITYSVPDEAAQERFVSITDQNIKQVTNTLGVCATIGQDHKSYLIPITLASKV